MSKEEVIKNIKSYGSARGAIINKYGQKIEVREYTTRNLFYSHWSEYKQKYWFYFCDDKLVQWGKAGDWVEAQKLVYDINFKMS